MARAAATGVLLAALIAAGCSRSNNLLEGRVEARAGSHTLVVTDCYRTATPAVERLPGAVESYRFTPCRDARILIRDEVLEVNGVAYGPLNPGDAVTVDHGRVLVNNQAAIPR